MRRTSDGKYIYVVDGVEADDDEPSLLGDPEEDMSDIMSKVKATNQRQVHFSYF
jgi:hypothetical protein